MRGSIMKRGKMYDLEQIHLIPQNQPCATHSWIEKHILLFHPYLCRHPFVKGRNPSIQVQEPSPRPKWGDRKGIASRPPSLVMLNYLVPVDI